MRRFFKLDRENFPGSAHFSDLWPGVKAFAIWILVGAAIGALVGLISTGLGYAYAWASETRVKYPLIVLALPAGGALIVFLYRLLHDANDKGTNAIVSSLNKSTGVPLATAPLIFVGTVISQLLGSSTGREGAAIQLGGSLSYQIGKRLGLNKNALHTLVMCGMSAGFSALFGTPMAAAVFAIEFARVGAMHYSALLPSLVAAFVGRLISKLLGLHGESFVVELIPEFTAAGFGQVLVLAIAAAAVSVLLCAALHYSEHFLSKYLKNTYVRIAAVGAVIAALSFIPGARLYLGSGMEMIDRAFAGEPMFAGSFLAKILFTALCIGAGYKGGEVVPTLSVGAALGFLLGPLLGLPSDLAVACGMVGLFCGVTNCPMTSLLLAFEIFGFEGAPYYITAAAVSFALSGYHSLYREQRFAFSKTETTE